MALVWSSPLGRSAQKMKTLSLIVFCTQLLMAGLAVAQAERNEAGRDGEERALRDVATVTAKFDEKSSEDLIKLLVPSKNAKRYGGYDYFYASQLNYRITQELRQRGEKARATLTKYLDSKLKVYEAINGPGDTVGTLCRQLLRELDNAEQAGGGKRE